MRTFVEFYAPGHRRLVIEASAIIGVMTSANRTKFDTATAEAPATLIVRGSEPVDVIGMAPALILGTLCEVAEKADDLKDRLDAPPIVVKWLDDADAHE